MGLRETIRLTPSSFRISGPEVEYDIETWTCGCRQWPIVVASSTWDPADEAWKREHWFVRSCKLCNQEPRP